MKVRKDVNKMKKLPVFKSEKDKWSYMQRKGKVFCFFFQPLILTFVTFILIFMICFVISLFDHGYKQTIESIEKTTNNYYFIILSLLMLHFLVVSSFNVIGWFRYKRNNGN